MKAIRKLRYLRLSLLACLLSTALSCQKFLNVEPIDSLSGNNFMKNQADAESFTLEMYRLFRMGIGIERPTMLAGDLRHAPVVRTGSYPYRRDIPLIANGQIRTLLNTQRLDSDLVNTFWVSHVLWNRMDDWTPAYKVIQTANILYDRVPGIAENTGSSSSSLVNHYQAEAVFMRAMTYFILIRQFADVPYFTQAYNNSPLPRTSHLEVARRCLEDLEAVKNNLPWAYSDPANRGVRANRGGALALMMHLNMWCAGFDEANAAHYYQAVDELGDELLFVGVEQEKAYELLPIERTAEIFNGRSREGLFEIPTNPNYADPNTSSGTEQIQNFRRHFVGHVLHAPYFILNQDRFKSEMAYESSYMNRIYPIEESDGRKLAWFRNNPDMYAGNESFLFFKFFNFAYGEENTPQSVGYSQIVFRLADAILLQAEALHNMGQEEKAIERLNRVRVRAQAGTYPGFNNYDTKLGDAIYWERCKELMGEGHYYYDLIRTHKILDVEYCWNPMSYAAFLQDAWAWPIHPKALTNNPHMRLNNYWE